MDQQNDKLSRNLALDLEWTQQHQDILNEALAIDEPADDLDRDYAADYLEDEMIPRPNYGEFRHDPISDTHSVTLAIPESIDCDYDVQDLYDLGVKISWGEVTLDFDIDANGKPSVIHTNGKDSFSGRFEEEMVQHYRTEIDEAALTYHETIAAAESRGADAENLNLDDVQAKLEQLDMTVDRISPAEFVIDYRIGTAGYEAGNASDPASANVVANLQEALIVANGMASIRDRALEFIHTDLETQHRGSEKTEYCVLSADELRRVQLAHKGESEYQEWATTTNNRHVTVIFTEDGLAASDADGASFRVVKENSGAHLAEVKAEFADQDISIQRQSSGEISVDFRQGTFGHVRGSEGSAAVTQDVSSAAQEASSKVEWKTREKATLVERIAAAAANDHDCSPIEKPKHEQPEIEDAQKQRALAVA